VNPSETPERALSALADRFGFALALSELTSEQLLAALQLRFDALALKELLLAQYKAAVEAQRSRVLSRTRLTVCTTSGIQIHSLTASCPGIPLLSQLLLDLSPLGFGDAEFALTADAL
jgi:hypothetical protein